MDYAMSSDASATSDLAYRRTCDQCKTRMSSRLHDRHSIFIVCRGFVCFLRSVVLSVNHGLIIVYIYIYIYIYMYPISTLPEHLHSTFPSHAKLPENTLTEKKNIPFPSLTLITCLTGPPVTPPPLRWETQPHPLIHNHSVLSAQGERSFP